MSRPPLMSPGHRLPHEGIHRLDIVIRLAALAIGVVTAVIATATLWIAGQLSGLLAHGAWPDSTPADALGISLRLPAHLATPRHAWPPDARADVGPAGLVYSLWLLLYAAALAGLVWAPVRVGRKYLHRSGFASRKDLRQLVTAKAVLDRVDVLRPALTIRDTDTPAVIAVKERRRTDPLEVGRLLGYHAMSGEPLYLANEYTELLAAAARFGGKTSRYIIPRVLDARGAVLTTSTRLDVAAVTYAARDAIGPTFIFEPLGKLPGVPRLRWSPIEGAEDMEVAALRAKGFAAGAGIDSSAENGAFFQDQAAALIRAMLHAAALDERCTLEDIFGWAANPSDARPEKILRYHQVSAWADRLAHHREATGRTRDSIQSVVFAALDCFSHPTVLANCSPPRGIQYQVAPWLAASGTLYLVGPRTSQAAVAPLLAAIAEDIFHHALQASFTSRGGRIEPNLYFLGDEITNVAPLPSLPGHWADGGGAGISMSIACQNEHQLEERWGQRGGRALRDGANARIVLGGTQDVSALRDAQALIGQTQELTASTNWGGTHTSVQEHLKREYLVDLAALRNLPAGRALVLLGNMPPVEVDMPAWWERDDGPDLQAAATAFNDRIRDGDGDV
ncbi:type IV secretory system conjugative DNA transfer family protein [Catenuloplanes atrovinosus]|uniref:Type IV secretory pathway TraG/TraD family ATPase VirD4 n=1 Tax=Catenuloplanes atrovinosus TaxID=137266 RepID=A0AAE3YSK9_9ACTN|nr:TraM recognition domain-containing protein [Catenuloplanes atrovinosus]MDR7277668.1 type IV secretory pathway TraG/TraD family ATPase VirD4 [Catenuloplanes atrovinosus]